MATKFDELVANPRGQAPGRTSFLTRFRRVLRRYLPRGVGLRDMVSDWRCRGETTRSRRSSGWTPADACAQTSSDFVPRSDLWSGHGFGFAVGESPLRSVASAAHLLSMPSCTTTKPRPPATAPYTAAPFSGSDYRQTVEPRIFRDKGVVGCCVSPFSRFLV